MPEDQKPTAGTPGGDDGDAREPAATTGTPAPDDGNAGDGEGTVPKSLHLANVQTIAELKAQVEELQRASAGSQPAPGATGPQLEADITAREKRMVELRELAKMDRAAALLLEAEEERQTEAVALRSDVANAFTLQQLPVEQRGTVYKEYQTGRHMDMASASREVQRRALEKENVELRKQNDALRKNGAGASEQAGDGVAAEDRVRTGGHDKPITTTKPVPMLLKDFERAKQDALDAGDVQKYRQLQRDLNAHKIVLQT